MASYGNTVLTSAGIDLVKRVIAKTATFEITRVATSSDSRLTNATISAIEAMTALPSVNQTGTVTALDASNDKQIGLKCEFTNQGLTNQYSICGVGIYAKEAGKSEILFAVAPAKEPETMPAKPNDQSALFSFSLNMYVVVGQASAMSITATTEGVVKSINGTIKPDANGNVILPFQSQAEANQLRTDLTNNINNTAATLTATITKNKADADSKLETEANTRAQNDNAFNNRLNALSDALTSETANRKNNDDANLAAAKSYTDTKIQADKTSVYDKATADSRFVNASGDTMTGNLVLDSSHHLEHLGGVVNFSKEFGSHTSINSLFNAVRKLTGCSGSFSLTAKDGKFDTGWYNFVWIPHRNGGIGGNDNSNFGTMLLVPFDGGSAWIVTYNNAVPRRNALAWDDNFAATTNTANAAKTKAEANANSIQALSDQTDRDFMDLSSQFISVLDETSRLWRLLDEANKAIGDLGSKMTSLMPQAAYVPIKILDNTDLNNMKNCGFYLLQGGTSNSPVNGWTYVTVQGISTRLTQFVWKDLDPSQQWCRVYDGSNWTTWTHYTKAL